MDSSVRDFDRQFFARNADLFQCPFCGAALESEESGLACSECGQSFSSTDGIPQVFAPNEWDGSKRDVTDEIQAFYEKTPFPNYDGFDDVNSLAQKARRGIFARLLDEQVPFGSRVVEVGCGTGQLSNFLSVANRTVIGADLCLNSLRLAQGFKQRNGLNQVFFVQMNLFRPCLAPESFDVVICNGVLHHTSDPYGGFQSIARLVKPNRYIVIGLYHKYGRIFTDFRRKVFAMSGDRFKFLDGRLGDQRISNAKREAWFADQYKNPHESKHTIGEGIRWLEEQGFEFLRSIPKGRLFAGFGGDENLFEAEEQGSALERWIFEVSMGLTGFREGGFFVVIGRKRA